MPIDTRVWLTDPRINAISMQAKGVWVTMLCFMWESSKRGMLVHTNEVPLKKSEIMAMLGINDDEPLQELMNCGLLSLNRQGIYYSAEMVRQADISEKRRNAGKKGGDTMKQKLEDKSVPLEKSDVPPQPPIEPPPSKTEEEPLLFNGIDDDPQPPAQLTAKQIQQIEKKKKYHYAECVTLTREEYAKLCEEYTEDGAKRMIELLDNYKGSVGKRYKSDYRAILNWVVDRYNEENQRYGNQRQTISASKDTRGGVESSKKPTSGALPFDTSSSGSDDKQTQEGYSERF